MEKKEVKMEVKTKNEEGNGALTYEQLNNACSQLYQQNQNLIKQIQQLNQTNMFKRLDYLFTVLNYATFFDPAFVNSCADEIQSAMTIEESHEEAKAPADKTE